MNENEKIEIAPVKEFHKSKINEYFIVVDSEVDYLSSPLYGHRFNFSYYIVFCSEELANYYIEHYIRRFKMKVIPFDIFIQSKKDTFNKIIFCTTKTLIDALANNTIDAKNLKDLIIDISDLDTTSHQ